MAMKLVIASFFVTLFVNVLSNCMNGNPILARKIDAAAQKTIVDVHNTLRNKIASGGVPPHGPAQNIRVLKWDPQLARGAQQWAEKCLVHQHSPSSELRQANAGESLAGEWNTDPNFLDSPNFEKKINNWFNEVYSPGYHGQWTRGNGHFVQLIWANTERIGCGHVAFKKQGINAIEHFLVCRYSPPAFDSVPPFEKGSRNCRKFNLRDSYAYPALCE